MCANRSIRALYLALFTVSGACSLCTERAGLGHDPVERPIVGRFIDAGQAAQFESDADGLWRGVEARQCAVEIATAVAQPVAACIEAVNRNDQERCLQVFSLDGRRDAVT